jgi:hypothetical protein
VKQAILPARDCVLKQADRIVCVTSRLPYHQRFNRRESKRYSIGSLILIFL